MLETLTEELKQSRAFEEVMRGFAAKINADSELLQKLTQAVDDGISRDGFRDMYVSMAEEQGFQFTTSQMEIAMHEQKQGKDKILPSSVQKLVSIL